MTIIVPAAPQVNEAFSCYIFIVPGCQMFVEI